MKKWWLLNIILFINAIATCQQPVPPTWDNTRNDNWPVGFKLVEIRSSTDGAIQKAWFFRSSERTKQPLIVSLHTWSGNYNQEDPLAKEIILRKWNYIHPDFRGSNNRPEACGSELVIADLEDAISYALKEGNVDSTNVHIIGVSGGGYATLLAYMKLRFPAKSFNAWAPISDLVSWYWESKGRNSKYANDIEQVAMTDGIMNWAELFKRSPINLSIPAQRKTATLNIYAGIHDGYTGSVPITHSILFYNKIAAFLCPEKKDYIMPDSTIISLVAKRRNPKADTTYRLNNRIIHWQKQLPGLSFSLFEGGHEMLVPSALVLPPIDENKNMMQLNILTIGDSNGEFDFGWPQQMRKLLPYSNIINKSVSGNTVGFDNLEQVKLNTLKNIKQYLDDAYNQLPEGSDLNYIFLGIGTNDTKTIFKDRQKEVPSNMKTLLQLIKDYLKEHNKKIPRICIISPPPMDETKIDQLKYGGGDERIQHLNNSFKNLAIADKVYFLDTYTLLKKDFERKTNDGIHLNESAQFELATYILSYINTNR